MTREELKAHCERQIEQCKFWAYCRREEFNNNKIYQEHKLILELLKQESCEEVERVKEITPRSEQTDCEYCHEDSDGYVRPIEKNGHASIHATFLRIKANGWSKNVKINFCPMCGRKLEVIE